jgi:hypothetical protein
LAGSAGPALLDVLTSRMELVMPPFVGVQQVVGTALYSAKPYSAAAPTTFGTW